MLLSWRRRATTRHGPSISGDWVGKITTLEKHGEDVLHRVDGSLPQPGTRVHGTVDWERRYSLMQTHTALHILCGIIWHEFGRLSTGCDMKPGAAHIDFELDTVDQGMTTHLQHRIDEEVAASRPIHIRTLTRSEAEDVPDLVRTKVNLLPKNLESIRIVEIEGLDLQADGGTHVANTSEVGTVRIVRTKSKGRHNKRLYLEVG